MKKIVAILLLVCMLIPAIGVVAETGTVDEYNFTPFKITVTNTGSASGIKRLVVSTTNFPFTIDTVNQLVGCYLNGTVTYSGSGSYSASVPFVDVKIVASDVRTGKTAIDFVIPTGYTINLNNDEDSNYTWDLTISPKEPAADNDIPQTGSTFFVTPDMFTLSGHWSASTDSGYSVLYGVQNIEKGHAKAAVKIPANGTYGIYSFAKDFATNNPGTRFMNCTVNDVAMASAGKHGTDGYAWEKIGEMVFSEGDIAYIDLLPTSAYFSRVAALMFTTEDYTPATDCLLADLEIGKGESAYWKMDSTKTNLMLTPGDFGSDYGTWTDKSDGTVNILFGLTNSSTTAQDATAKIKIPADGTYYVWGCAKDYTSNYQGYRACKIGVNGTALSNWVGVHGADKDTGTSGAYGWDLAGSVTLKAGTAVISAVDAKQYNSRLAAVMLTTDPFFNGIETANIASVHNTYGTDVVEGELDFSLLNAYGNKLSFTLKNRTTADLESGVLAMAIYDENGDMVDVQTQAVTSLGAGKSLTETSVTFEASRDWKTGKVMLWKGFDSMIPLRAYEGFSFMAEDFANPDEDADANFGTVSSYMLDYAYTSDAYKDKEYNVRGGIYNTLRKLQSGEDITIGYLGGSITQQESWRPYTTKWFEETYDGKVTEVSIGLSGTGADLAVCRIDGEVLTSNPDLVFIEYAVNGGAAKDMEGMALKIWEKDPTTDIIFVYTTQTSNYATYKAGNLPDNPKIYETVATHYNIPSVFFGYQAFDMYDAGKLTLSGSKEDGKVLYTQDGIHLTADGGWLAAGAIARCVTKMEENFDSEAYTETNHTIPTTTVAATPWSDATCSDDWSKMKFEGTWLDCSLDENDNFQNYSYTGGYLSTFKQLFPNMTGTTVAGSSVTVKFKGTDIGVFEAGGQYSGQLKVIVDGVEQTNKLVLYHASYDSKLRHQYYFIPSLTYGEHTVTFILDSEMPDKSALQAKNPTDTTYEKNEFYLGRILLNGELLDVNQE